MPLTPGWYTRNRVLVWICALIAVNQLGFGSIVPVVPLYASAYGVSQAAIGLTIGLYGLARFLVNVPAGALAERVGRRGTLALGGVCTALGNLLCAVAPGYAAFLGARFLAGIGAALTLTAAQIVLADISTPARRGRIMATYSGVFAFAVGIGPYPGGLLAERLGLAAPFYAFAALSLAGAALGWWRVPETRGMSEGVAATASAAPAPAFAAQLRVLLARPPFTLISLVSFGAAFARTGALFNVIPLLGRSRLGLAPAQIGLGLGLISVVGLLLAYPSGALVDRFGRKLVIVPATLLTGVAMLLFAAAPSYRWFIVACAVWSIASGIGSNAPGAYAADNAPLGMNAAAMSTYRMLGDLGYVVGPLLLGFVADAAGANAALGGTAVVLTIIAALFARYAPETYRATRPLPAP
jgi:DHA1 family multidrug resistance protein-like MFS transporter